MTISEEPQGYAQLIQTAFICPYVHYIKYAKLCKGTLEAVSVVMVPLERSCGRGAWVSTMLGAHQKSARAARPWRWVRGSTQRGTPRVSLHVLLDLSHRRSPIPRASQTHCRGNEGASWLLRTFLQEGHMLGLQLVRRDAIQVTYQVYEEASSLSALEAFRKQAVGSAVYAGETATCLDTAALHLNSTRSLKLCPSRGVTRGIVQERSWESKPKLLDQMRLSCTTSIGAGWSQAPHPTQRGCTTVSKSYG